MKKLRRILSLFLVLAMCVSLLPVSALAEEEAAVEVVSVEELTELVEPEETPVPEITEEVEETADPEVTEEPAATEAPVETEEPEETEIPAETEEPEETETPAAEAEQESETLLATSGTCGDNVTWTLSDDGVLTISGTGDMWDYSRPTSVPWVSSRESIEKIVVEAGVTVIGEYAFYSCSSLTEVTIPDSVTTIGQDAFSYCESLTEVTIPDSVTTIGQDAFLGCSSLTEVTIPDSVTTIDHEAFLGCSSLTSVTIGDSLTSIGESAFWNCNSLTEVTIGNSVTTIGASAFWNCDSLTAVTIPDSVTTIGEGAFWNCDSLTEVTIPDSVTTIGEGAFYSCSSLTHIYVDKGNDVYASQDGVLFTKDGTTLICCPGGKSGTYDIPDNVTTIVADAFVAAALTEVTIPDSVTTIGDSAFWNCDSLTEVTIPDSVTTIGDSAFSHCDRLTGIHVNEGNAVYASQDGVLFTKDGTTLVCCPGDKSGTYAIPDNVTTIGASAFLSCDRLIEVTIPDSVTTIGDSAFSYCESLTEVTIPDSVTTIGDSAFLRCYGLTEVTIPDNVTTIGDSAFYKCTSLTDVYYTGSEEQWREIDIYDDNEYLTNATIHYTNSSPLKIVPGENAWAFSNSPSSFGKRREGYEMTDSDFMRLLQNLNETDKWLINIRMFKPLFKLFNINIRQKWGGSCYGMSTWVCLAEAGVVDAADIADKSPLGEYECTDIVESAINYYHMQQYIALKDDRVTEFQKKSQQEQLETLESLAINASETGVPVLVLYQWYKSFDKKGNCETSSPAGHAVVAYGVEEGDFTDYVYERMELKGRQDGIKDEYEFTKRILVYDCSRLGSQTSEASHIYYTEDGVVCIPAVGFISTDSQTADTKYNNGILELATVDSSYLDMVNYNTGETSDYYKYETNASANALYTSNSDHSLGWGDDTAEVSGFTVLNSIGDEDIRVVVFANETEDGEAGPVTKMIRLPESESYTMETEEEIDFQLHCGDSLMTASAGAAGTVELETDGGVHVELETAADYDISITANDGCADMTWNTIQLVGEGATEVSAAAGEDGVVISGDDLTGVRVVGRTGEELADLYFTTEESSVLVSEDDSVLVIREDADKDGVYEKEIMSSDIVGDVNGSGVINCMDLVSLMKYLVGMTEDVAVNKCDMNGDDNINIQDAVCLVKTLATEN